MTYIEKHEVEAAAFGPLIAATSEDGLVAARRTLTEAIEQRRAGGPAVRTKMMPASWYARIDTGIRFPVRVLHAAGLETCQSCEGGPGHDYPVPSIELPTDGGDSTGFAAMAALATFGLDVSEVSLVWSVSRGLPGGCVWRLTLRRAWPERADEELTFVHGIQNAAAVEAFGKTEERHVEWIEGGVAGSFHSACGRFVAIHRPDVTGLTPHYYVFEANLAPADRSRGRALSSTILPTVVQVPR